MGEAGGTGAVMLNGRCVTGVRSRGPRGSKCTADSEACVGAGVLT